MTDEFQIAIMEVSEDLIDRKTKNSVNFAKSLKVNISKERDIHLQNTSESIFKGADKRRVL
jgi:hypothetical protein